jgi:hypothetical protein
MLLFADVIASARGARQVASDSVVYWILHRAQEVRGYCYGLLTAQCLRRVVKHCFKMAEQPRNAARGWLAVEHISTAVDTGT